MADDTFARYRSVCLRIWSDDKFPEASDDAQLVWFHLFTNALNFTGLGLYKASIAGLAEEKRWPLERYKKAFDECIKRSFIEYDPKAMLIRFPNYFKHRPNHPRGANVVKTWGRWWRELPDSPLKDKCKADIGAMLEAEDFHRDFLSAYREVFADKGRELLPDKSLFALESPPDTKPTNQDLVKQATSIIEFLNEHCGRNYDVANGHGKPSHSVQLVLARLKDGATEQVCRAVIVRQWKAWKGDADKEEWMRPATLFGPHKFEQYAGKVPKA